MLAELCRDLAAEVHRRDPRVNVHEVHALIRGVRTLAPRIVVDLTPAPALWWAWWSLGAEVVGVSPDPLWSGGGGFTGSRLPDGVTAFAGEARLPRTRAWVVAALAGRPVDMLVVGGANSADGVRTEFDAYAPMVRPGGLVVVRGIADRSHPGVGRFWAELTGSMGGTKLIGSRDPDGYGVAQTPGKETADHG